MKSKKFTVNGLYDALAKINIASGGFGDKPWQGPVTGAALQSLALGIPTYYGAKYLSRFNPRLNPKRIGLMTGLAAGAVPWAVHSPELLANISDKTRGINWNPAHGKKVVSGAYSGAGAFGPSESFDPPSVFVPSGYTQYQLASDPHLSPYEKAKSLAILGDASNSKRGLISTSDIYRAAVGAGTGYAAGKAFSGVIGGVFGKLTPSANKNLVRAGVVAGLLRSTGIWK
jgi:hypothetical protein